MAIDRDQQQETRALRLEEGVAPIQAAIAPVLQAHGVELADVVWTTEHSALTLRVTIERRLPPGTPWRPELGFGVNLDDCAEVSRGISAVLDTLEELTPDAYALEVSSPGLDRPLRSADDFVRFAGTTVKVKLKTPAADGQRVLRGKLVEATTGQIAVLVDGKRIEASLSDIADASLVFELSPGAKPVRPARERGKPSAAKRAPTLARSGDKPTSSSLRSASAAGESGQRAKREGSSAR